MQRLALRKENVTVPIDAVGALARLFYAQIMEFPKKIGRNSKCHFLVYKIEFVFFLPILNSTTCKNRHLNFRTTELSTSEL